MLLYDSGNHGYLRPPGGHISLQSSPRVAEARSQVVDEFIRPGSPVAAEWLFWLDADASFDRDILARLMEHADAEKAPIVGALAFGGSNPDNMFPTVYSLARSEKGWELDKDLDYPRDALVKVGATGCHCVVVHRSVFIKMGKAFEFMPDGVTKNPYPWYVEGHVDAQGRPIGEDIAFCIKAQAIDAPVFVHTGIISGHVKEVVLDQKMWDEKRKPKAEVFQLPEPAVQYRDFQSA
jgi:hypothetical protein